MGKMPLESGNLIQMQSGAIRGSRDGVRESAARSLVSEVDEKLPAIVAFSNVRFDVGMYDVAWLKFLNGSSRVVRLMCFAGQASVANSQGRRHEGFFRFDGRQVPDYRA